VIRRAFVLALLLAVGVIATPLAADAQQPKGKIWRIGFISGNARTPDGAPPPPLRTALKDLGYVDGQNVVYVARFGDGRQDRLPALAAELVAEKVDVIVTVGGPSTGASRGATSTIPIVMALVGDADGIGLINSLAQPGGNVTGVTDQSADLSAKRLELLKETVPKAERIAVLYNADDMGMVMRFQNVEKAAQVLRVTVRALGVREPNDFDTAFTAMTQQRPDALFLVTDALTNLNRKKVIEFAATHKIPAIYEFDFLVQEGGLMSYGASQVDNFRMAAGYVDRIFKGAEPRRLPVERPSRYYLAINLKTARTLGLTLPPSVLLRADHTVE
jgi:putative ABC transport system substrate-binding protein